VVIALGWLPVFLRFFRSWRARSNPISIAICVLILFAFYLPVYLAVTSVVSWPFATVVALDAIACTTFYVTFHFANRKFPDTRKLN
jgi:hypothetical protein